MMGIAVLARGSATGHAGCEVEFVLDRYGHVIPHLNLPSYSLHILDMNSLISSVKVRMTGVRISPCKASISLCELSFSLACGTKHYATHSSFPRRPPH